MYVQNSSGYLVRLQNTGKAFIQRSVNLWLYLERWINNLILFLEDQGVFFFWETWFVSLLQFIYVSSFYYGLISETLRICGTNGGRKMNLEYWWNVVVILSFNWRRKIKYPSTACPTDAVPNTNSTWTLLGSKSVFHGGRMALNHLRYGTAICRYQSIISIFVVSHRSSRPWARISPSVKYPTTEWRVIFHSMNICE